MRLKEPLYGIKIAGMHFIYHIILAVTMGYILIHNRHGQLPNDIVFHCPDRTNESGHKMSGHILTDTHDSSNGDHVEADGIVHR